MPKAPAPVVLSSITIASSTPAAPVTLTLKEMIGYPKLYEIARCESHLEQFNPDGTVLKGIVNSNDIGILQINETYNGDLAKKLGFDIYSLEGNIEMGKWIYEHEGTGPWSASESCWLTK